MRAVKGNRVYSIDETVKTRYQNEGFDIYDEDGNVIAYGKGKTVPYPEYAVLKEENDRLKQQLAGFEGAAGATKKNPAAKSEK